MTDPYDEERLLSTIVALGELEEMPDTTPEGIRRFWQPFKLKVENLKDIYAKKHKENRSNRHRGRSRRRKRKHIPTPVATTPPKIISIVIATPPDVSDSNKLFRSRLLANISALGELVSEMKQMSPITKRLFWEAIKLEIKALRDLDDSNNGVNLRAIDQRTEDGLGPRPLQLEPRLDKELTTSDSECTISTKSIHSQNSPSTTRSLRSLPSPRLQKSSRCNSNDEKEIAKSRTSSMVDKMNWRRHLRSVPTLSWLFPPASPDSEWLRPSVEAMGDAIDPKQQQLHRDTRVMEMIFYFDINAAPGAYKIATSPDCS